MHNWLHRGWFAQSITGYVSSNEEGCELVSSCCHAVNANPTRMPVLTRGQWDWDEGPDYALSSNIRQISVQQRRSDKDNTGPRHAGKGMKRVRRRGQRAAWRDRIKETKMNYIYLHRIQCMQAHTTHANSMSTSHGDGNLTRFKPHKQRSSVDDSVGWLVDHFGPDWNVITNDWMEFQYIIQGPQRLRPSDLSSSSMRLTFFNYTSSN